MRLFLLFAAALACTSEATTEREEAPLFHQHHPLELTLVTDFDKLLQRSYWSGERWFNGRLRLRDEQGIERSLAVRVKSRGGYRARTRTCTFPQLFVDFSAADASGTVFAGRRILPLNTHCRAGSVYSAYVHRELIAYRIYNLLSDKSLRARAALISYEDDDRERVITRRYAFFIEHFDELAERLHARIIEPEAFLPEAADAMEIGIVNLFQFMIGNTDWSAVFRHNVLLLQAGGRRAFAVPYDFDYSGLVNASYAAPGRQFKIRSVRTRVYRGYCQDGFDEATVADYFQRKRPEVFALIRGLDWMPAAVRKDAGRYVAGFYAILDSPAEFRKQVSERCLRGRPVPGD